MKRLVSGLVVAFACPAFASGSHSVRPYTTRRGTYVAPHRQTNSNGTRMDNWSHQGNVNPYTGKKGTRN